MSHQIFHHNSEQMHDDAFFESMQECSLAMQLCACLQNNLFVVRHGRKKHKKGYQIFTAIK